MWLYREANGELRGGFVQPKKILMELLWTLGFVEALYWAAQSTENSPGALTLL